MTLSCWPHRGMHYLKALIGLLEKCCNIFDLFCNTKKTVCMVFVPRDKNKIFSHCFPEFILNGQSLRYVSELCYLGHVISNSLNDENDIHREIRNMYVTANTLFRKFNKCSTNVKVQLFPSYCICLYGVALWEKYSNSCLQKFKICYNWCIKLFFGFSRMQCHRHII